VLEGGRRGARQRVRTVPAQPCVGGQRRAAARADCRGDRSCLGDGVAAREDPRLAGGADVVDVDHPVLDVHARRAGDQLEVGLLAQREHHAVRAQLLDLAGRAREAVRS
jgi:hypothetical protein